MTNNTVHAAWNNSAIDFINQFGEQAAVYKSERFWTAQWGTKAFVNHIYRIIGWQVRVRVPSGTYGVNFKIGGTVEHVSQQEANGRIYDLWAISYNDIVRRLKSDYPGVDFSSLENREVNSIFYFDAIMTTGSRSSSGVVTERGGIDDRGNRTWGTVHYNYDSIMADGWWSNDAKKEISKLFDISEPVSGNVKPPPPTPINRGLSIYGHEYQDGNTYWVQQNNPFSIYADGYIESSKGSYPTHICLNLERAGNVNGVSSFVKDKLTTRWGEYDNNFETISHNPRHNQREGRNYLDTDFTIKPKVDNTDYKAFWTTVNGEYHPPYSDSSLWVKVDGTAPTIEGANNVDWVRYDQTITILNKDNRSGPKSVILKEGNNQLASGGNSLSYMNSNEGIRSFNVEALDNVGNKSTASFTQKIDKTAPTVERVNTVNSFNNFTVDIRNIQDHLSGNKNAELVIYKSLAPNNKKNFNYSIGANANLNKTYGRNELTDIFEYNTDYTVEVWTEDQVGNKSKRYTGTTQIYDPTPVNDGLDVTKYDYKTPNQEIYWVKPNSIFNIDTRGYMFSTTGQYPHTTEVLFKIGNDYAKHMMNTNNTEIWNMGDFTGINTNGRAIREVAGGKNFLKGKHILQAKYDNKDYPLHYTHNNNNNYTVKDSGKYLKTDGTAPTSTGNNVVDRKEDTFELSVYGVTDNNRSGVNKVQARVWVDNNDGKGRLHEQYIPLTKVGNTDEYRLLVNRNNFGGNRRGYFVEVELIDNVGNIRKILAMNGNEIQMLQYNLKANRIDIFDTRENRYVSQIITGLEYEAVIEYTNIGELDVKPGNNFTIALTKDNAFMNKISISDGIRMKEVKNVKVKFRAANTENLKGNIFSGVVDYDNNIDENNEGDNRTDTKKPYDKDVTDKEPPTIPVTPEGQKPDIEVPIITVQLDLVAHYIDVVALDNDKVEPELIVSDTYRVKHQVLNNSSLALKYIDVRNKTFIIDIMYDGKKIGEHNVTDIAKGEIKTLYTNFTIPELPNDLVEKVMEFRAIVDSTNRIYESNETNNQIAINKKVIGLKLIDYRIMSIVHPIVEYQYPIYIKGMPAAIKAGYNATFRINVRGKADRVYADISDSNGKSYPRVQLTKVRDIDSTTSEYEYVFAPPIDTPDKTIFITNLTAERNTTKYNYNSKENWNGHTLKINGNAEEDILIYRKY